VDGKLRKSEDDFQTRTKKKKRKKKKKKKKTPEWEETLSLSCPLMTWSSHSRCPAIRQSFCAWRNFFSRKKRKKEKKKNEQKTHAKANKFYKLDNARKM
jgi:hypothetical protein